MPISGTYTVTVRYLIYWSASLGVGCYYGSGNAADYVLIGANLYDSGHGWVANGWQDNFLFSYSVGCDIAHQGGGTVYYYVSFSGYLYSGDVYFLQSFMQIETAVSATGGAGAGSGAAVSTGTYDGFLLSYE